MQGGYDGSASPGTIPKFSVQPQRFGPSPEKASSKRMHTAQPHSSQGGSVKRMQTAQPHSSQEEYEFNRKQEKTFDNLASMIYQTSVLFFFMFAVTCTEVIIKAHRSAKGAPPDVATISDAVDYLFYAYFLYKASQSFSKVTLTKGNDISNLMTALNELYLLFKRMRFVSAIYVLKTTAMIVIESPNIKKMFKTPKSNLKSPLDMTATQATLIIVVASFILTGFGAIGMKLDKRSLDNSA